MGASCAKDKSAAPKNAGNVGNGDVNRNNAGGRPAQHAANKKVPEKEFGNCGVMGNHNNGKAAGGGIAAYKPADDVAKTYFERIHELRNVAIATGVLPAVEGSCDVDSIKNNDGSSAAETNRVSDVPVTACPPLTTLTVYQCQPLVGDTVVAKGMYSSVHLARLSVFMGTSEAAVNPTVPRHPIGRRASDKSSIMFASDPASVVDGESGSVSFVSGPQADSDPLSPQLDANVAAHYIIAMKELPMYASYSTGVMLDLIRMEVRSWTRLSAYSSRVLRCYTLEYVYGERVSSAVPEACCNYFPGLSNEVIEKSPKAGTGTPSSASPIGKLLERKRSPSGGSPTLFGKTRGNSSPSSTQGDISSTPQKLRLYLEYAKYGTLRGYQSKEMPEKFNKSRLHELTARAYMRDVLLALLQVHENGELQYDVCAKAIFLHRPVQLVYSTYFPAYISDVPTGDLTSVTPSQLSKCLGLLDPPLPKPTPVTNNTNNNNYTGSPCRKGNRDPFTTGNEPISGAAGQSSSKEVNGFAASPGGLVTNTRDSGAYRGQADISVITQDASMVPQVSTADPRYTANPNNNNNNNNTNSGSATRINVPPITAYEQQDNVASPTGEVEKGSPNEETHMTASQSSPQSPLRKELSHGSPKKRNSGVRSFGNQGSFSSMRTANFVEGDEAADHKRLNDIYCRYMDDYDFTRADIDTVPFPSPHDGMEAQADADLVAATMLPEEPRLTPPMRVVPLQRSSLGGVAVISPDHYLVKPGDALHAPDLRGRLPMVLSSSTDTNALVCGSPHTTAPCFTPSRASYASPAAPAPAPVPLTHTMSSGTSMADAAGSLGRSRGGVPLTKLNHTSLIRRALAYGDADKIEDIPVHKYVTVTHAAPEVLHRRTFSAASDIYAFAMTFIELVTDDGNIMTECLPQNLPKPKTRREKDEYDAQLTANLDKWYQTRLTALRQHYDAVAKEQELPATVSPRAGPTVVRIPEHLSDEGRNMLRWCLQADPQKRPTAAELLRSRYFMLGDWIAAPTVVAAERITTQPPEKPWDTSVSFDAAARAAGLPMLPA